MNSNRIMWAVALALVPGFGVLSWFYGWGYLQNLVIALPMAYAIDFACLGLRGQRQNRRGPRFRGQRGSHPDQRRPDQRRPDQRRPDQQHPNQQRPVQQRPVQQRPVQQRPVQQRPVQQRPVQQRPVQQRPVQQRQHLIDGSIFLGTLILVSALPPAVPWHVLAVATFGMIVLARQLYGGLGHNIFNPAMVGYVLALICFPTALATWPPLVDGHTGATALTAFKYREGLTAMEIFASSPAFGQFGGHGWEWANVAFALGGIAAAAFGLIAWRVVLGFLIVLGILALVFYDGGSSRSAGSPLFHYLSAGTMLAAFFVVTDPVTHPGHATGQWLFGAIAASVTFAIRTWGGYPDGIAFGVLIANAAAPFLDALGRGRVRAK